MTAPTFTPEQRSDMADIATSYVMGAEKAMEKYGIDQETLDEVLLGENVERCEGCGWYDDCHALLGPDSDEPDGHCSNCR